MPKSSSNVPNPHVLIVEDEYLIAAELGDEIAMQGAEVVGPVLTLDEAYSLIGNMQVDGAVLDIVLRDATVYALADTLMEMGVPCVFATGHASKTIPFRFRRVPCFEKPFESAAVARAILDLCSKSRNKVRQTSIGW